MVYYIYFIIYVTNSNSIQLWFSLLQKKMYSTLKCPATICKKNFSFHLDTSTLCVKQMCNKFYDDKYFQNECRTRCADASSLNTGTSSHISLDF